MGHVLKYDERNMTVLKPEENILQSELDRFNKWTVDNKILVNSKKCFVMKFLRSRILRRWQKMPKKIWSKLKITF